jgi:hypothetical protein
MGYTHYFRKKELVHDQKTWDKFLNDTLKVASRFGIQIPNSVDYILDKNSRKPDIDIPIGDGMGDGGSPTFNHDEICFNGVGDDSHETFRISRDHSYLNKEQTDNWSKHVQDTWKKDAEIFDFTKTNRKPYDLLVTAVMTLYKHHFKDKVEISGDGGEEGFDGGINLVNDTLKYSLTIKELIERD